MRIELTSSAWKAEVLPLNYTRLITNLILFLNAFHVSSSASHASQYIRRDNSQVTHDANARG